MLVATQRSCWGRTGGSVSFGFMDGGLHGVGGRREGGGNVPLDSVIRPLPSGFVDVVAGESISERLRGISHRESRRAHHRREDFFQGTPTCHIGGLLLLCRRANLHGSNHLTLLSDGGGSLAAASGGGESGGGCGHGEHSVLGWLVRGVVVNATRTAPRR